MSYHNNMTFTELTEDDITTHEDLYINELLVSNFEMPAGCCGVLYYDYAIIELQKANDSFSRTFG